jgi:hypothetical protein
VRRVEHSDILRQSISIDMILDLLNSKR